MADGPLAQLVEHLTLNQGVQSSILWRITIFLWPGGQEVKTPPFHGGIAGSIPAPVTTYGRLAQLGERLPYKQNVSSSILLAPTTKEGGTCGTLYFLFFLQKGFFHRRQNSNTKRIVSMKGEGHVRTAVFCRSGSAGD